MVVARHGGSMPTYVLQVRNSAEKVNFLYLEGWPEILVHRTSGNCAKEPNLKGSGRHEECANDCYLER